MITKDNIGVYYTINIITNAIFFLPIFVVFLQDNGLSLTQVALLQTIFSVTIIFFEIPSGFIADIQGRKKALIMGTSFFLFGLIIYSLSTSFLQFCIGELFWGTGFAFLSGSGSALLYDTLLETGEESKYKNFEGNAFYYGRVASIIATLIGSFLAVYYIRLPFIIMIPIFILNIIVAFSIKEPQRKRNIYKKNYVNKLFNILKFSLVENKEIRWLICYAGIIGGFGTVFFWFIQPYLLILNIPLALFGLIFALTQLITAITAKYSYLIEKKIGKTRSLQMLGPFVSISPLLMGIFISKFSLIWLIFLEFAWAFHLPVIKDYINKIVYSDKRATVLSISSFFTMIIVAIFSPLMGYLADTVSLSFAYVILGLISLTLSLFFIYKLKKDKVIS